MKTSEEETSEPCSTTGPEKQTEQGHISKSIGETAKATGKLCPRCREVESESFVLMGREIVAMCDACELEFESKQKTEQAKRNQINREAMIANHIPERYRDNDLSRFPAEWRDVSKWRPTKDGGGLLLAGVTGKCKTRMIAQLLCNLHRSAGIKFRYLRSTELSRLVRQQFSDFEPWVAKSEIESLRRVPILFIDDLGKQTATQSVEEELFDLIEERTSRRLPILATCNASARDLEGMMSEDRGAPLIRRLVDYCDIVKLK